jgi:hypothetical protein
VSTCELVRAVIILKEGFETFSVYGLSMDYPEVCRVEFNPKSRRDAGDVVFHFPDRERLFLSWGSLEEARKRYADANAQAIESIDRAKRNRQVRSMENVEHESLLLQGHQAIYNHMRFQVVSPGLLRDRQTGEQETHSIHLHCPESGRYYVVYGSATSTSDSSNQRSILLEMASSLRCHKGSG